MPPIAPGQSPVPEPPVPEPPVPEPVVSVVPDKLRGTLRAAEAAAVLGEAALAAGWRAELCPLSDGGEGFLEVLGDVGGGERTTTVTGPLGEPVAARWRLAGRQAVVESAQASGLELVGGADGNDPVRATSAGTGELVSAAVAAGARRVIVGVGGSAMTDGGLGAVEALEAAGGFGGAEVVVACDVEIGFVEAAERFAPQKGAGPAEVAVLRQRLEELAAAYRQRYGVDVTTLPGAGAAGGLAGGLAALGARLVPGFELVADVLGLEARLVRADLALSAEGRLDATSWEGKVVGGVAQMAGRLGLPLVVLAGSATAEGAAQAALRGVAVVSLEERYGPVRARSDPAACLAEAAAAVLRARAGQGR
jgi:glycerate 2-kinase